MLLSAFIISVGVTDKGKEVWGILTNQNSDSSSTKKEEMKPIPKYDGNLAGAGDKPAVSNPASPGTYVGEKGAGVLNA